MRMPFLPALTAAALTAAALTAAALMAGSPASAGAEEAQPLNQAGFARAKALYFRYCAECHGRRREGGIGKPLTPEFTTSENRGYAALRDYITWGTPAGMPAWGADGVLSAEEIDLLARYLMMDPPPPPPEGEAQGR